MKEGRQAVALTRLFRHRSQGNEAELRLSAIAYNLGNLWPLLALPKAAVNWSLLRDGESQRTADVTCAILLVAAGGEPPDSAAV